MIGKKTEILQIIQDLRMPNIFMPCTGTLLWARLPRAVFLIAFHHVQK